MKKTYYAPSVECLAFCCAAAITADDTYVDENGSQPWNDGELGWT